MGGFTTPEACKKAIRSQGGYAYGVRSKSGKRIPLVCKKNSQGLYIMAYDGR